MAHTDTNGSYTSGTYSDGRAVRVYGRRNGFAYIAFVDDLSWVTKVPGSWVTDTTTDTPAVDITLCTCCHYATAGYSDHETGEDHTHCRHGKGILSLIVGEAFPAGDESWFSYSTCEGCGTTLAGDRYSATQATPRNR